MSTALIFTLDMPPSTNALWRNVDGRTIKSRAYRTWLDTAAYTVSVQRKGVRVEGAFSVEIRIARPDRRKRDLDNRIKPLLDALVKGGAIVDDSLCQRLLAEWVDFGTGATVTLFGRS